MATPAILTTLTNAAARARNTVNVDTGRTVPMQYYNNSRRIYTENERAAPFTVLLENMSFETSWDDTYRWDEDAHVPQGDTLSGSVAVGGVALAVAAIGQWTVNDVVLHRSSGGEGLVTAVTPSGVGTAGTITISWVVAPVVAIANGQTIVRIGNAHMQIDSHNQGPTTIPVEVYNVYQDMRHGVAASRQYFNGKFRHQPDDFKRQVMKKKTEHELEKEKTLIFGRTAALWATGNTPRGFSRGLYYMANTNTTAVNAALTRTAWDTFLLGTMQKNEQADQNWWFIGAGEVCKQISQFANSIERTDTTKSQFGMGITRYKTPLGDIVKVLNHPMFFKHGFTDMGLLVNMSRSNIYGVFHQNMATALHRSIQPQGRSAIEDFYWSVFTLCFKRENINLARMTDVTAT